MSGEGVVLRPARIDDAREIHRLVVESGVLDPNSVYAYLLVCTDFGDSCVVAERAGRVVGFVSGYRPPRRPDVAFLWQIGVAAEARGQGLAKRLVSAFLESPGVAGATWLETTVTPSNEASRRLFRAVARDRGAGLEIGPGFDAEHFGSQNHEREDRFRIGPLTPKTNG